MSEYPKVFISYAHIDKAYEQQILKFANYLRNEQEIDANVDLYEEAPPEGWPRWMENQVIQSDYVLVVCSQIYENKFYHRDEGKGVKWEGALLYNSLYEMGPHNTKFIPVYFNSDDLSHILPPLKQYTHYCISDSEEVQKLCNRIHGIRSVEKPQVRKKTTLPHKEAKTLFYSSPIKIELWNKAKWRGALYCYEPGKLPILGLVYTNLEAGNAIFEDWRRRYGDSYVDDYIRVDFIIPPFPKNNYVMKESGYNYGKGYHIHIGPNVEKTVQILDVIRKENSRDWNELMFLSRFCWMDTTPGVNHREAFIKEVREYGEFKLCPVSYSNIPKTRQEYNGTCDPYDVIRNDSKGVLLKSVHTKAGVDLRRDRDICGAVLNKPGIQRAYPIDIG